MRVDDHAFILQQTIEKLRLHWRMRQPPDMKGVGIGQRDPTCPAMNTTTMTESAQRGSESKIVGC
jgi:hypothetical protein